MVADITNNFYALWLDYSNFSGVALDIFINSSCIHKRRIPPAHPKIFPIKQVVFNTLFPNETFIPQVVNVSGRNTKDFPVRIVGHIYPLFNLCTHTLYKIDLSIFGNFDGKEVIFNSIHKHFLAEKDKKLFQKQAEKALKKCFYVMKQAFLDTKDRKVYIDSNKNFGAAYKPEEMIILTCGMKTA